MLALALVLLLLLLLVLLEKLLPGFVPQRLVDLKDKAEVADVDEAGICELAFLLRQNRVSAHIEHPATDVLDVELAVVLELDDGMAPRYFCCRAFVCEVDVHGRIWRCTAKHNLFCAHEMLHVAPTNNDKRLVVVDLSLLVALKLLFRLEHGSLCGALCRLVVAPLPLHLLRSLL